MKFIRITSYRVFHIPVWRIISMEKEERPKDHGGDITLLLVEGLNGPRDGKVWARETIEEIQAQIKDA